MFPIPMPSPRVIGILAVALLIAGLSAWGLWERGGKMEARVDVAKLEGDKRVLQGQVNVLAVDLNTQNHAIDRLRDGTNDAQERAKKALAALDADGPAKVAAQVEIGRLNGLLTRPAAENAGKSCTDAWKDIRGGS